MTDKSKYEGVIASLAASGIWALFSVLFKLMSGYSSIFPDYVWLVVFGLITGIILFAINSYIPKDKIDLLRGIVAVVTGTLVFVCFVHFILIALVISGNSTAFPSEHIIDQVKRGILLSLGIIYLSIIMIACKTMKKIAVTDTQTEAIRSIVGEIDSLNNNYQSAMKKAGMNSALTSTVIPFKQDNNGNLITYLIDNTAYPEYTWMFPGGHVLLEENQTPHSVAFSRARDEAGLTVRILDIYNSFDQVNPNSDNKINNMSVFYPPHYFNLFKLNDSIKCFREKGHEFHIDAVYVAEVLAEGSVPNLQKRISVHLPRKIISKDQFDRKCHEALRTYYRRNHVDSKKQVYPLSDYVIEMMYAAYIDYINYLTP